MQGLRTLISLALIVAICHASLSCSPSGDTGDVAWCNAECNAAGFVPGTTPNCMTYCTCEATAASNTECHVVAPFPERNLPFCIQGCANGFCPPNMCSPGCLPAPPCALFQDCAQCNAVGGCGWVTPSLTFSNVALAGIAAQSSVGFGGDPSRAIDGNHNAIYSGESCTHTNGGAPEDTWWRVDLQGDFIVQSVSIRNRGDCCSDRLSGFTVRVGDSVDGGFGTSNAVCGQPSQPEVGSGALTTISCGEELRGRFVSIALDSPGILTLCEVEVIAAPVPASLEEQCLPLGLPGHVAVEC